MLRVIPVTFRQACKFVADLHRHNKPPRGHKFSIGVVDDEGKLVGVAMAGRPIARALDDGLTLEINRTCTNGARNANSKLYGACWRAAKAMGYLRCITYTQQRETGASLRAAGFVCAERLPPRGSWREQSKGALAKMRDPKGSGGVARVRWEIRCQ